MSYPAGRLQTTLHFPEGSEPGIDDRFEIDEPVYFAAGDRLRWDRGELLVVRETLFVLEKNSPLGADGLHVWLEPASA